MHGRESILNQPLFLNTGILNQGKEIYLKKWLIVGIVKVRDVLYEYKEGFLPMQYIIDVMEEAKEDISRQEIKNKYEIIKHAIPKQWITKIETMEEEKDEKDVNVMLGEKMWIFKECTVKMFYGFFRDAVFKKPIINEFWQKTFEGFKEETIWNNMKGKIIMLGSDKNNKNEKMINLFVMLMKSAIWERRIVAKQEKKVLDVWLVFKRRLEKYMECLYYYFKQEQKMDGFY